MNKFDIKIRYYSLGRAPLVGAILVVELTFGIDFIQGLGCPFPRILEMMFGA